MNYYPFHIGDYLSATRHLSWEEDCAYRRLLDVYYTNEKPLPLESRQVCRLVLATTDSQREAVSTVLAEFFKQTPEGWVHGRADAEIEAMRDKQQKQRDKANAMWARRRANAEQSTQSEHTNAPAMPRHDLADAAASSSDANAMPPTPTPTPTPTKEKRESTRGSRMPPDWAPGPEGEAFAAEAGLRNGKAAAELEKFRDYWAAQPGQRGVKTNWQSTWRNWVRRAAETVPGKAAPPADLDDMFRRGSS